MVQILPGWYDGQNRQSVNNLFSGIAQQVFPNFNAQKRFEAIAQQNPQIMETISNMDVPTRLKYAESLGFKGDKLNTFLNLPVGAKLQAQNELQGALGALTPSQKAERAAAITNTTTTEDSNKKDALFNIQLSKGNQDLSIGKQQIQLNDQRATSNALEISQAQKTYDDHLRLLDAIPNVDTKQLKEYADSIVFNKPWKGDPLFSQRVQDDKVLKPVLDNYINAATDRLRIGAQRDLKLLQTPQERAWPLAFYKDQADNAANQQKLAETSLAKLGALGQITDPQGYAQVQAQVQQATQAYNDINSRYIDYGKKALGLDLSSQEDQDAARAAKDIVNGNLTYDQLQGKMPQFVNKVKAAVVRLAGSEKVVTPKEKPSPTSLFTNPLMKR